MTTRAEFLQQIIEELGLSNENAQQLTQLLESFARSESRGTFILDEERTPAPKDAAPLAAATTIEHTQKQDSLRTAEFDPWGQTILEQEPDRSPEDTGSVLQSSVQRLGRYTNLGVLGVGGMGEVHHVRDDELKRTLAMKIIHPQLLGSSRSVARFIEEAQIEAQLQHPNIIPIHEIGQLPDGRHYFTMKRIRGTEFFWQIRAVHEASDEERWRTTQDGTSFRTLLQTFHQICVTIAYAHSQGVIHRDLKPENIMIGDFGEVLVVDWGLAKVMGSEEPSLEDDPQVQTSRSSADALATRMGSIAGTPCYMSPEQAQGKTQEISYATDIYTLGAILYEILSGSPPYLGGSAEEVIEKVKSSPPPSLGSEPSRTSGDMLLHSRPSGDPRSLETLATKIPERLIEICARAMQREPPDRYSSAEEFAHEIRAWLDGAEKRDKGLAEVELAKQARQKADEEIQRAGRLWSEANEIIERQGPSSQAGWDLWSEARKAGSKTRSLERKQIRRLQGALVHAPELEEAHLALARIRLERIVKASAIGDRHGFEVESQQLENHLEHLTSRTREQLEDELSRRQGDLIDSQRARRGELVGRHTQIDDVMHRVSSQDTFITLMGTAGVGKTRLALELGERLRSDDLRALFCDLTEAKDALGVARIIGRVLDIRLRDSAPLEHLADILSTGPMLLILDNLEQIVDVIGPMARDWVEKIPDLRVIATSRVKLNVPGETVVPLKPMTSLEGVELFIRRGQAADNRFELNAENRSQVCDLVQKLDGLPLAIELAAARLNILSLDQIVKRLDDRFHLLRTRGRDAQALQGALDWSWGLLQPWAKAALSQSSIFRGGFSLSAAESVIEVGSVPNCPAMFDILGELTDNSLLQKEQTTAGDIRYSLLESIRAYAAEKLTAEKDIEDRLSGPAALESAQHRHAAHFAKLGEPSFLRSLDSFESASRWSELFSELDNLVVAIRYGTPQTAPLCCMAALKVLGMKGPVSLGVDIATEVLALPDLPRRQQMQIEIERSKCLRISGRMREARAVVREAVSTSGSLSPDDPTSEG